MALAPARKIETTDDIPRRDRLERMVPAERLLRSTKLAVEGMGSDPALGPVLDLLNQASTKLSDFVDSSPAAQNPGSGIGATTPQGEVLPQETDPDFLRKRRRGIV